MDTLWRRLQVATTSSVTLLRRLAISNRMVSVVGGDFVLGDVVVTTAPEEDDAVGILFHAAELAQVGEH